MTKRLLKTKRDHRRARAVLTENTVTLTMTPSAGALTAGEEGVAHAGVTFALTNAVGNARFALALGELPPGMTLSAAGVLSGTPTAADDYSFSIRGTDDFGNTKTQAYTLAVAEPD
jgi:hypothetical protein